jgi:hypothetical protein
MNELLNLIWGFIVGSAIAWVILKIIAGYLKAKNEILREQLEEVTKKVNEAIIHVNVEKHGEVFYLFEKETDRFIAQGTNFDEIKAHCLSRFKEKTVVADEDQLNQLGFK